MTSRFQIRESRLSDCGQLARALRRGHRNILVSLGADPHRELRACFEQSAFRRSWLIDGRLAAIGGVTGTMASSDGTIWLAVSEEATRFPKAMIEEARRQLDRLMGTRRDLSISILIGDTAAYRFARRLGFHVKHPIPFDAKDFLLHMEICRDVRQNPVMREDARPAPFIIYTAGRSRTTWLSSFLTYGDWCCHDEVTVKFRSMDQVGAFFQLPNTGTAETAGTPAWRLVRHYAPKARIVVVRRDLREILASFEKFSPVELSPEAKEKLHRIVSYEARCLDRLALETDVMVFDYHELTKASVCKELFEHCLPYHFDYEWWRAMDRRNIQANIYDRALYAHQHRDEIEAFKRTAKRDMFSLARAGALASAAGDH